LLTLLHAIHGLAKTAIVRREHWFLAFGPWRSVLLRPGTPLGGLVVGALMLGRGISINSIATGSRQRSRSRHGRNHCAHGRGHSDCVRVAVCATFDLIAWRQEGIEALNQVRITGEQGRHAFNDPWGIDCTALEVLHDIKEAVVHVRVVGKLYFHLIQVAQGVVQNRLLALAHAYGSWWAGERDQHLGLGRRLYSVLHPRRGLLVLRRRGAVHGPSSWGWPTHGRGKGVWPINRPCLPK